MLKFTEDHEWLRLDGNVATVGITNFAQDKLGDLVFVELPGIGAKLQKGAAAAHKAVELVDGPVGLALLAHLRAMTARFKAGLIELGFETLAGGHPVVPLMLRDSARTSALVAHLRGRGILATGLNYPVVPKGDEEIRFQINADHTPADIDEALDALRSFRG